MPKTRTEIQRDWRRRKADEKKQMREAGLEELRIWAHPADHPPIKEHAAKLARKRAKESK